MSVLTQQEMDRWLTMKPQEIADVFSNLQPDSIAPPESIRLLILFNLVNRVALLEESSDGRSTQQK